MERLVLFWLRCLLLVSVIFSLTACGGGGGDSSGGGELSFSLSSNSVSFTANQNDTSSPASATITATAHNGYVFLEVIGGGATLSCPGENVCTITVPAIGAPQSMPVGTSNDTITVNGYRVQGASTPFMTKTIAVSYTITEGLTVSPDSLTFTAVETEVPIPQIINESRSQPLTWTSQVWTSSGGNWLSTSVNSGTTNSSTTVSVSALTAGSYYGYIDYEHSLTTGRKRVNVNYVTEPILAANSVAFNISENSLPADLSKNLLVTLSPNATTAPNISWTASLQDAWLSLSQVSGDTSTNNTISLDLVVSELNNLDNGDYTTTITLTPDSSTYSPITVDVTLSLNIPQFNYVSPNIVYTGGNTPLIIRGENIGTNITSVLIGTNTVSVTQIDETKLELTQPPLAIGSYPIGRDIPTGINNSNATLEVINPPSFGYHVQAIDGSKDRVLFDAKRNAIFIASRSTQQIHRLVFNGVSWDLTSVNIPDLYDIELTPDSEILLATNSAQILHLDAVSLAQLKAITPPFTDFTKPKTIKVTNSGLALLSLAINNDFQEAVRHKVYSLLDDSFPTTSVISGGIYSPITHYSLPIRDRIVVTYNNGGNPGMVANNELNSLTPSSSSISYNPDHMHLSAVGDRGVNQSNVWSVRQTGLVYLGSIVDDGTTMQSVVSPDASRVYSYDLNGSVRTFDITDTSVFGSFPEIGVPVILPDVPGNNVQMETTPDGGHLIIAGDTHLIITPTP